MTPTKQSIRQDMLQKRRQLDPETRLEKSHRISQRLFDSTEYLHSQTLLVFLSTRWEVHTDGIVEKSFLLGKSVCVPVVYEGRPDLGISRLSGTSHKFDSGPLGIRQPVPGDLDLQPSETIDLVLVPGLAFDRRGGRLGYGGGYFDRLLSSCRAKRMALAFDFQMLPCVPQNEHDVRMDSIITESRFIQC